MGKSTTPMLRCLGDDDMIRSGDVNEMSKRLGHELIVETRRGWDDYMCGPRAGRCLKIPVLSESTTRLATSKSGSIVIRLARLDRGTALNRDSSR